MGNKKSKLPNFDFEIIFENQVIPSSQPRSTISNALKFFKKKFTDAIEDGLRGETRFPISKNVFVYIVQIFASESAYLKRDVDNMVRTVLNLLEGKYYDNDKQVKTLLVSKHFGIKGIAKNFVYIGIEELNKNKLASLDKAAGIYRVINKCYEEIANKKNTQ